MAAFKKFAQTESTDTMDIETKEEMLWNAPNTICRQYGTDIECKCDFLEELSGGILEDLGVDIPGITSPYAYLGTYGSHFSWHTEDMDLFSINILEDGASKLWYVVPAEVK